ncbi:succinylglutamate desuccinylase [Natronomonas sp. EA1]|uniref:succinylglutamate desuccinylase n=1 Tax=Natronomonas sp. EA1 TaxID=3421655 RepID=UPI003EB9C4A3
MRVEQVGDGEPELAIIGGIHGDEPCGPHAVEALLEMGLEVEKPVKLVIANEEALAAGTRYLDEDLNRAFPGDEDADTHEGRLAHAVARELRGCTVLSLHSTQSYAKPFALVDAVSGADRSLVPYLSVDALVETAHFSKGRLIEIVDVIEVECGLQGSAGAKENAVELCLEFLRATGALPGRPEPTEVPVFRLARKIAKPVPAEYEVFVENFERVAAGERFAVADDEAFAAEEPFYPILLSAYGYEDVFGYAADLAGQLTHEAYVPTEA